MLVNRKRAKTQIQTALDRSSAVALIGPRQCGKTTLCREFVSPDSINYFDLEDPVSQTRLDEPMTAMESLQGLISIDEIQRSPELFPVLRVLIDRKPEAGRFLILGSAGMDMLEKSSESLAGRLETIELGGLPLAHLVTDEAQEIVL